MYKVTRVEQSENSKVVTFRVEGDFLGPFGKIVILKGGRLLPYSPLAQQIYGKGGDVNRVDFAVSDGATTISIARKLMSWDARSSAVAHGLVQTYFQGSVAPLFVNALQRDIAKFETLDLFDPKDSVIKKLVRQAFLDQVNPVLARDGGAMELLNVEIAKTGDVTSEVALFGSCNSCGGADESTLKKASEKIREVLGIVKANNAQNADLQKLDFKGISVRKIDELILAKS